MSARQRQNQHVFSSYHVSETANKISLMLISLMSLFKSESLKLQMSVKQEKGKYSAVNAGENHMK